MSQPPGPPPQKAKKYAPPPPKNNTVPGWAPPAAAKYAPPPPPPQQPQQPHQPPPQQPPQPQQQKQPPPQQPRQPPQQYQPPQAPQAAGGPQQRERGPRRSAYNDFQLATLPPAPTAAAGGFQPLRLWTNHFNFNFTENHYFQHTVAFDPPQESAMSRRRLIWTQVDLKALEAPVFDGQSIMFTPRNYGNIDLVSQNQSGQNVTISVRFTNEVQRGTFAMLQVVSLVLKRVMNRIQLTQLGRNYYDANLRTEVAKHHLELWPGYFSALHPTQAGIALVCDVSHAVIRTDNVLVYARTQRGCFVGGQWNQNNLKETLTGSYVLTRYNNKRYRIDDLDFTKNPHSTFPRLDKGATAARDVSFLEYYRTSYPSATISDERQWLIVSRQRLRGGEDRFVHLIPELCYMTGISDAMRDDRAIMQDLAQHTRLAPSARLARCMTLPQRLAQAPQALEQFRAHNISITEMPTSVEGLLLPAETLTFGQGKRVNVDRAKADWTMAFRNNQLFVTQPLNNWVLIASTRDSASANAFMGSLRKVAPPLGIQISPPRIIQLNSDPDDAYVSAIQQAAPDHPQLIFVVLPQNKKERYSKIKVECYCKHGIPSQCVLSRNMQRKSGVDSVVTKLAVQMNCKLGGAAWSCQSPLAGQTHVMIVGIDVCHDRGSKSIAAFCATMNPQFTRYFSKIVIQQQGQEPVEGLQSALHEAILKYRTINGVAPTSIIIYRDGVGEGQLNIITEFEIPQLTMAIRGIEGYNPGLMVIVVKKRIHTRLFLGEHLDRLQNPLPGSVADRGITHMGWYDFFLISQATNQGTVSPTHYHVVFDNTRFPPQQVQQLTFKLCHMYFNWSGTISVPSVCQYAHKCAFLNSQNIHRDVHASMQDSLYYL